MQGILQMQLAAKASAKYYKKQLAFQTSQLLHFGSILNGKTPIVAAKQTFLFHNHQLKNVITKCTFKKNLARIWRCTVPMYKDQLALIFIKSKQKLMRKFQIIIETEPWINSMHCFRKPTRCFEALGQIKTGLYSFVSGLGNLQSIWLKELPPAHGYGYPKCNWHFLIIVGNFFPLEVL